MRYVLNNPINRFDPLGLKSYMCKKPLQAMGGKGKRSGPDVWGNPLYHQYYCVERNGVITRRRGIAVGASGDLHRSPALYFIGIVAMNRSAFGNIRSAALRWTALVRTCGAMTIVSTFLVFVLRSTCTCPAAQP